MNDQEFESPNGNNKTLIVTLAILAIGVAVGGWLFYSARAREHARLLREKNAREACQSQLKLLSGAWRAFADGHVAAMNYYETFSGDGFSGFNDWLCNRN